MIQVPDKHTIEAFGIQSCARRRKLTYLNVLPEGFLQYVPGEGKTGMFSRLIPALAGFSMQDRSYLGQTFEEDLNAST